ncbi:MAG TPA: 16S rRNA (uracil(1498)-N(3))-methyltransferase [Candidatus Competibacteraceae bacterium]|nr:16S rRNA (uracil(1498)-N(3))-methyltransferase [Candidatus Competibacteraceae bacterium]
MRIPRVHLPVSLAPGAVVALDDNAFNHLVRVLRLKPGAALILFNGAGGEYRARLETVEKRGATARVEVHVAREAESPLSVLLAQGVSKGERMDYTLQKAVELGVTAIQPLLTAHSVVSLDDERWERRRRHWQGVVVGACEQCGRNRLPALYPLRSLGEWLATPPPGLGLMLDPLAEHGLRDLPPPAGRMIMLLVGPEGGLSETEIAAARIAGFRGLRLGPRVMRTETAGVAALAALQALWGDLG